MVTPPSPSYKITITCATVMNSKINICVFQWYKASPVIGSFDPPKGAVTG